MKREEEEEREIPKKEVEGRPLTETLETCLRILEIIIFAMYQSYSLCLAF